MHHHLFSTEDTYVTNLSGYEDKNFGINEILRIGTDNKEVRSLESTKGYDYVNATWTNYCVTDFTGTLTGSFTGSATTANGVIASSASFSSSYFSGSINGATIIELSGSVSGSISGSVTGSLFAYYFPNFSGALTGSTGKITGTVTGTDTRNENWWKTTSTKFVDRAFIKFNLDVISASIASGEITSPVFKLNLKVCNEYELPISYKIYAFPISQSWVMGNGYYSDGGSNTGTSWYYTDKNSGSLWYTPITTSLRPVVDFLNTSSNQTASFAYGGGTWYYTANAVSMASTQSFAYESADISMDVTPTVKEWLSGSIPNNGFILISSDEIVSSGSGFSLTFYGRDTNSINSPYLDVMWDDWTWETGSVATSSVVITSSSGMNVVAQTGSTLTINGGVDGIFSGSAILFTSAHYITASNVSASGEFTDFSGSYSGSLSATISSSFVVNGIVSGSITYLGIDYFSGSINSGSIVELSPAQLTGSYFYYGLITGSMNTGTGSVDYFEGTLDAIGIIDKIVLDGIVVSGTYYDYLNYSANGIVFGTGLTGNITGLPIIGPYTGSVSVSQSTVTGPCGSTFDAQIVSASFTGGIWSGLLFSAYYIDGKFENAHLTGSWPSMSLLESTINIPLPSGIDSYAYAYITGPYVSGKAVGSYVISGSISGSTGSESASFSGQFIEGPFMGGYINLQLSGSIYTSSYTYTSSVVMTSSVFSNLDTERPFTLIIKNLKPQYKGGDLVKIRVMGRKEFPMKTFAKTSQQIGYLTPELLPSSSYYAIKDNMSEEIIVNFDNYTRISSEYPEGNYFMLDTTGLAQERPYRILIRVEESGSKYTFDNNDVFKIVR